MYVHIYIYIYIHHRDKLHKNERQSTCTEPRECRVYHRACTEMHSRMRHDCRQRSTNFGCHTRASRILVPTASLEEEVRTDRGDECHKNRQ